MMNEMNTETVGLVSSSRQEEKREEKREEERVRGREILRDQA